MKPPTYCIGIDCGVSTGICIWDRSRKAIEKLRTVKIHVAMEEVRRLAITDDLFVRVEDARQRKWVPRYESESRERGRREGAGSVKRDAKIWEDFLTDLGVPFEMVAPKNNKTKVTAAYFKKLTGYMETCSQHARDAALLVYGY